MNVGLFFGSFNPIHTGHLIIANHFLNETSLEKIWFIVSPQNPFKKETSLLNEYQRLHLLKMATEDDSRIWVSDIEFNLPRPSYTSVTLSHLQEKYPNHHFSIIMGSDSFQNLHNWKNFEFIIKHFAIHLYKRPGAEIQNKINAHISIADAPLLQISASQIRNLIQKDKSIRYLVPDKVREEIAKANYYK